MLLSRILLTVNFVHLEYHFIKNQLVMCILFIIHYGMEVLEVFFDHSFYVPCNGLYDCDVCGDLVNFACIMYTVRV